VVTKEVGYEKSRWVASSAGEGVIVRGRNWRLAESSVESAHGFKSYKGGGTRVSTVLEVKVRGKRQSLNFYGRRSIRLCREKEKRLINREVALQ